LFDEKLILIRLDGLGESLLHPDICEFVRIANRKRVSTMISTNFSISRNDIDICEELVCSGLDHLIVSIDGHTQEVYEKYRIGGDLKLVIDNVKRLVSIRNESKLRYPFVEIQFIGFEHSREFADEMKKVMQITGADRLTLKMMNKNVLEERSASDFIGHPCFFTYNTMTVGSDMRQLMCPNGFIDKCTLPDIGNIKDQSEINNNIEQIKVREFLAGRRDLSNLPVELGPADSREIPWGEPRKVRQCRCLSCAGPGMVADRNRSWFDNYVCT